MIKTLIGLEKLVLVFGLLKSKLVIRFYMIYPYTYIRNIYEKLDSITKHNRLLFKFIIKSHKIRLKGVLF